ncbi:hypothetical protein PVAND_011840 [Polypedilum vanderplanki]|uniref:VPS9 domain-containing protein n=1 Tax=Polypedilum vanderplanki TaxID=319348 RepID=A0A9J6CJU3_POLVA|nr:hypothetical protein PVAND_011840 [Polypedilum vanderplanki]
MNISINYEEDLQKNPLYLTLMQKSSLLQEICINNWIFALPRKSSYSEESLKNHEFILSHILSPSEELPKTHFINLIGDEVVINEQSIKMKNDKIHQCVILFEEFYFTKDLQKFKIMCIDMPLNKKFGKRSMSSNSTVKNVQESIEFIHQNCSRQIERKIQNAIKNFNLRMQKVFDYKQLQINIKLLYDYCINIASNRKIKDDQFLFLNVKIAIEYIVMDAVYEKIFDAITIENSEKNIEFNKILRKLSNITLNDLNLSHLPEVTSQVNENINVLRIELLKIDKSKCAFDKLSCIKNVIDIISLYNDNKLTATDELLPMLVYIIIKSNYFYFISTLIFIKEFNLSQILNSEAHSVGSAFVYILTTIEAIIYFIQTNEHMKLEKNQLIKKTITIDDVKCQTDYIDFLFKCIYDNDEVQLEKYLKIPYSVFIKEKTSSSSEPSSSSQNSVSCHPLCACLSCENLKNNSSSINVNLTSQNDMRMLHIAAFYNLPKIVSLLLINDAEIDATNENGFTALHIASMNGHQKVLFLLLHGNANINLPTKDKKTSLILASMYGHEHCVKALIFFSEHTHMAININAQDIEGNTALHYASQCGFLIIVDILLEYQAKATLKNNIGKTPLDYAYNSVIKKRINDAVKYQVEELPVAESEFVFIRKQDLAEIFEDTK